MRLTYDFGKHIFSVTWLSYTYIEIDVSIEVTTTAHCVLMINFDNTWEVIPWQMAQCSVNSMYVLLCLDQYFNPFIPLNGFAFVTYLRAFYSTGYDINMWLQMSGIQK